MYGAGAPAVGGNDEGAEAGQHEARGQAGGCESLAGAGRPGEQQRRGSGAERQVAEPQQFVQRLSKRAGGQAAGKAFGYAVPGQCLRGLRCLDVRQGRRGVFLRFERGGHFNAVGDAPRRQDQGVGAEFRPHLCHSLGNRAGAVDFQAHGSAVDRAVLRSG